MCPIWNNQQTPAVKIQRTGAQWPWVFTYTLVNLWFLQEIVTRGWEDACKSKNA